jgi:hypothetical protein
MAKRNDQSGAPIKFRVSENIDGRGARIVVPVNRSGWKPANYRSKPTTNDWIVVGVITALVVAVISALILNGSSIREIWPISLCLASVPVMLIIVMGSRAIYHSRAENTKKRKKKQPKHRKDYK